MNGDAPVPRPLQPPLPFAALLRDNQILLQPPSSDYCLFHGKDFILTVVGGPNSRNDYHVNETEEWFYQLKGSLGLKIVESDTRGDEHFKDVVVREGEMFLLPGNTPVSPVRGRGTFGLVMERTRSQVSLDRLRWYCRKGGHDTPTVIREVEFHCTDLGTQLKRYINEWRENESLRKCPVCGQTEDPQ